MHLVTAPAPFLELPLGVFPSGQPREQRQAVPHSQISFSFFSSGNRSQKNHEGYPNVPSARHQWNPSALCVFGRSGGNFRRNKLEEESKKEKGFLCNPLQGSMQRLWSERILKVLHAINIEFWATSPWTNDTMWDVPGFGLWIQEGSQVTGTSQC